MYGSLQEMKTLFLFVQNFHRISELKYKPLSTDCLKIARVIRKNYTFISAKVNSSKAQRIIFSYIFVNRYIKLEWNEK